MKRPSLITALLLHLGILAISHAIYLDIHVPLPSDNCLMAQTLRANELLRSFSDSEQVDLFSRHTPHITLFLAEFDLELEGGGGGDVAKDELVQLNATKVDSFLETISSMNFTHIVNGLECSLSLSTRSFLEHDGDSNNDKKYYTINGAYTMLNVQNTPCLKALSNALLDKVESFVKRPVIVPSWVASLPEPQRSAAIYRSRKYGSPNVLEGFVPHLTVGFDPSSQTAMSLESTSMKWREDAMKQWNEVFTSLVNNGCHSKVKGIAAGKNGVGGTVLADSRLGYWSVDGNPLQVERMIVM